MRLLPLASIHQPTTQPTNAMQQTRWACNICGLVNELPRGFECPLDGYGHRRDRGALVGANATIRFICGHRRLSRGFPPCQTPNPSPSYGYIYTDMRPEFSRGSVDFLVGRDYCVRPPQVRTCIHTMSFLHPHTHRLSINNSHTVSLSLSCTSLPSSFLLP